MNILILHNKYRQPGGEDLVVESEYELLKAGGVNVDLYLENNQSIIKNKLLNKNKTKIELLLNSNKYDVVHIHNLFHNIGSKVLKIIIKKKIPIVQTIHNFRYFCINGLFHDGKAICEKCYPSNIINGVIKKCYQSNYIISGLMTYESQLIRKLGLLHISKFIMLNNFAKNYFINSGVLENKITVKPNFLIKTKNHKIKDKNYVLFIGRLSKEKGLDNFLNNYKDFGSKKLIVAGNGPDHTYLKNKYGSANIIFCGRVKGKEKDELLFNSSYVVVPSLCYEMFPLSIIEAYSAHKPVLASNLGGIPEIVIDKRTGLLFNPDSQFDVENKIKEMENTYYDMGKNAYKRYLKYYTSEINYKLLMDIYQSAIDGNV